MKVCIPGLSEEEIRAYIELMCSPALLRRPDGTLEKISPRRVLHYLDYSHNTAGAHARRRRRRRLRLAGKRRPL